MIVYHFIAVSMAFALILVTPSAAQWLDYPTPGIPRLPDGKPNLTAPAPRTADGKPNLSGIWHVEAGSHSSGFALNVAQDLEPDAVQPWARAVVRERVLSLGKDAPMARCVAPGLPSLNAFPAIFSRIVQTPEVILIVYTGAGTNDVVRTVFTDGRTLPDDPNPAWFGYSIGRWESDTLVITTSGFNDRGWLDFHGYPQTESLRITERVRRRDVGHMDYEMTLEDPKVFTRPVSITMEKVLLTDTGLLETVCENEKDAGHLVGNDFRLSNQDLMKYAGTYEFAPGRYATITVGDGFLFVQEGPDGLKRALVPQSDSLFVFRNNGDDFEFVKDARGTVTGFLAHGRGEVQKAVRNSDTSPGEKR